LSQKRQKPFLMVQGKNLPGKKRGAPAGQLVEQKHGLE